LPVAPRGPLAGVALALLGRLLRHHRLRDDGPAAATARATAPPEAKLLAPDADQPPPPDPEIGVCDTHAHPRISFRWRG